MGIMKEIHQQKQEICFWCADQGTQCRSCKMCMTIRGKVITYVPSTNKILVNQESKEEIALGI